MSFMVFRLQPFRVILQMFKKEEQMKKQLKELRRKQLREKEMKTRKRLVCLRLLLRLIILYLVVIDKGRYGHISFFRQNKNVLGVIFFPIAEY